MNEFNAERPRPWNIYSDTDSSHSPSQMGGDNQGPWKSFGTSMSAVSLAFVATAILVAMFLIMAIFEHLFRPNASFSSALGGSSTNRSPSGSRPTQKLGNPQTVSSPYASGFSVVMPGQRYPTYIAQHAPLLPFPREGAYWPSHQQNFALP